MQTIPREQEVALWLSVAPGGEEDEGFGNRIAAIEISPRVGVARTIWVDEKGEVTADVTSAVALSAAQSKKLIATLKASSGKDVKLNATVDDSLIGGLIVKLGSVMIDTSIKAKLASLQNAMKEVG